MRERVVVVMPPEPPRQGWLQRLGVWLRRLGAKALRLLVRLLWRYRSELAPASAAAGLLAGAGAGHLLAPQWWWTALPGGLVAGGVVWRWAADRPAERRYVEAVGAGAAVWLAIAWRAGLSQPLCGELALGAAGAAVPWWQHRRRRTRVRMRRILEHWRHHAEAARLPGSRVQSIRVTSYGCDLRLRLRPGQTVADVTRHRDRLASALGTRPDAVRVEPEPRKASRCIVRVVDEDPLARPLPWLGTSAHHLRDRIALGRREDGKDIRLSLYETHLLIAGASGKGKSGMLGVVLAELVAMPGVEVWGIDLKGGQELSPWADCLHRLATDRRTATELLREARRLIDQRGAVNAASGARKHWPCTAEEPAIALVIDEFSQLDAEGLRLATEIVQLGRSVGVVVVLATQNPSAKSMGDDTTLRSQIGARICLGVHEAKDADVILGTGMVGRGWAAHELDAPGKFLLLARDQGHAVPRWCRGWLLTEAMVQGLVAQHSVRGRAAAAPPSSPPAGDVTVTDEAADRPHDGPLNSPTILTLPVTSARQADPLLAALGSAPPTGLSVAELGQAIGLGKSQVYARLRALLEAGEALQVSRGRFRAATVSTTAAEGRW